MSPYCFFKKYFFYILLVFFGLFTQITSSEFWPITISKSWLNIANYEPAIMQKPFFDLILSLFHLLPANSFYHLLLVKFLFSVLGVISVWLFIDLILLINSLKVSHLSRQFLALITVLLSPVFFNNYFRIRSDQLSFLLFTLFLIFSEKKNFKYSIFLFFLIIITAVKNVIFVIPCLFILAWNFKLLKHKFNNLTLIYFSLSSASVLIWLYIFNSDAFYYFLETYRNIKFPTESLKTYFKAEFFVIITSAFLSLYYIFFKAASDNKKYAILSLYFLFLIVAMPQSFSFYIASLTLFVYLPLLIFIYKENWHKTVKIAFFAIQIIYANAINTSNFSFLYNSNTNQFRLVSVLGDFASKYNLKYLDGMGSLPRNDLIPCFVSPEDTISNQYCSQLLTSSSSDLVIVTSRLIYLGDIVFLGIKKNYTEIAPNIWIKNDKITPDILKSSEKLNLGLFPITLL